MSKLLLILLIQLLYVPMLTLRTISMVKSLKVLTAIFGFLEAVIYIFGLAIVLSGEQNILEMIIYAMGFSLGLVAGIFIEHKLALGYSSVLVNINQENTSMVKVLRKLGYGVTVYIGQGQNGDRFKLEILTKRSKECELLKTVLRYEPDAFILSYEPKMFRGGYLGNIVKRKLNSRKNMLPFESENVNVMKKTIDEIKEEVKMFKNDLRK